MKSITEWIERKLFLKVNVTKTKVVRPTRSKYLGFTFSNMEGMESKTHNRKEKETETEAK